METTRANVPGNSMYRQAPACQGGGKLFYLRRERDLARGLLGARGHVNDYLVFQPAKCLVRILGDRVLHLNDALSEVRSQGAEQIASVGVGRLQDHYAELDRLIEAARDRVADMIDYCNKGSTGRFGEAVEATESDASLADDLDKVGETGESRTIEVESPDSLRSQAAETTGNSTGLDVFEALRQRQFKQGILTEYGRDQGCVCLQPSPFFGRFLGEVVYSLNDALRRLEGNTSYYVMIGDCGNMQRYFQGLDARLLAVGRDVDSIIACCKWKVV